MSVFQDDWGAASAAEGMIDATAETIELLRDLMIANLKAAKIPERSIAKIMNIAQSTVNERYRGMPKDVVEGLDFQRWSKAYADEPPDAASSAAPANPPSPAGGGSPALADRPEPDPWTELVPWFPVGGRPFTPSMKCRHVCLSCEGAGGFVFRDGAMRPCVASAAGPDEPYLTCPDCDGTGNGPERFAAGSAFVCMICHRSEKDGGRALPLDVRPLPLDPPEPEPQGAEPDDLPPP